MPDRPPHPDRYRWVIVRIRRQRDGREVAFPTRNWSDAALRFQWSDGNYGCDCNRHLFFEEMLGNEVSDDECACDDGLTKRYVVRLPGEDTYA